MSMCVMRLCVVVYVVVEMEVDEDRFIDKWKLPYHAGIFAVHNTGCQCFVRAW